MPDLHSLRVAVDFPAKYVNAYGSMIREWGAKNMERLSEKETHWDANKDDPRYRRLNPDRPKSLQADGVFDQSRLLRLCANLPYLAVIAPTIDPKEHRWTNGKAQKHFQAHDSGRMRPGCILDMHYQLLVKNCPKLVSIEQILTMEKHLEAAALIMSSFPEFLSVCERVSYYSLSDIPSIMMEVYATLCSEHLGISLMVLVLTDFFHIVPARNRP